MLHPSSAADITFLGEQDSPAERRLKEALAVLLRLDAGVRRAYLTRVLCDDRSCRLMLGLLTDDEEARAKLANQMDRAFAALFNTTAHLDVVFLSSERDAEFRRLWPPFYDRGAGYH